MLPTDPFAPVVAALTPYCFTAHDEHRLYLGLNEVFAAAGLVFERERPLVFAGGKRGRLDYYLPASRLAIEVKVQGRPDAVLRQLTRYAQHSDVAAVLLVTTLARLALVPESITGKPTRAFRIAGAFG